MREPYIERSKLGLENPVNILAIFRGVRKATRLVEPWGLLEGGGNRSRGGGVDSAAAASTEFHICSSVDASTRDILSSGLIRSRSKSFDATADMSRSRLLRTIPPDLDGRRRAEGRI